MKKLLRSIRENNVVIRIVNGDLKVFANDTIPDPLLIAEIKERKAELISFLSGHHILNAENQFRLTIPVAPAAENYPLSSAQRRLWILSRFEEGNAAYSIPGVYTFDGPVNIAALEYSFNTLIGRHEVLRTTFRENEHGEIRQFVQAPGEVRFAMQFQDLRQDPNQQNSVKRLTDPTQAEPFDLTTGPLLRASLFQLADRKWIFVSTMHHIISDGWSMGVLINELLIFYKGFINSTANPLPPLRIQYKDYAAWQQEQLKEEVLYSHKNYWLKQFEGEFPVLQLYGDHARPAIKTYRGNVIERRIDTKTSNAIKNLCREQDSTLFMGLLAAVNTLLFRYSGQEDIIIGSPMAGREHIDLENQIGIYINTLALRSRFKGTDNYKELLENIKQVTLGAFEHQVYPFDQLVDDLHLQRDMSRSALFDVMVALQNIKINNAIEDLNADELKVGALEGVKNLVSKFDISFYFIESGNEIRTRIEYNTDIFNKESIERFADHLGSLLNAIVAHPSKPICELDYLAEKEKEQLLLVFNDTKSIYEQHKTIIDLLEQQVKKTPGQPALQCGEVVMTWEQLNQTANQFGHYIRNKYKLRPDDLVGIKLERSEWLVLSLLGVLKAGGAYVPIDPGYPQDRIDYMIADSGCRMVIDEEELEKFRQEQSNYKKTDLRKVNRPGDLAYVMYTSGSTGRPKGVMIANSSVVSFFENFPERFYLEAGMSFGATTNFTFDISVLELLGTLVRGIKLVLITEAEPTAILKYAADHRVDALQVTPSRLSQLLEADTQEMAALSQLKVLLVGGEAMSQQQYETLKRLEAVKVINVYGPTETTIWSTSLELKKSSGLSIGKPLLNERILIVDNYDKLCPPGVAGEICIGGEGLARGYWNKPELTAGKFVPHPFIKGERIYRTGDLGRWLMDGNIEFIGRKDDQVKVRGYRIELGEIENTLMDYPGITSAVASVRSINNNDKEIVAYLVGNERPDIATLRNYLSERLPLYMIPGHFVQLDKLPLNSSGKVDRKSLPDPAGMGLATGTEYVAPRSETEKKLAVIWEKVLDKEKISIKDKFFDLGGHSIKATRLASLIHKEFDVKVAFKDLFIKTVLEEQARLIDQAQKTAYSTIQPVIEQLSYPLSPSQRRLWVLSQFEEGNRAYNVPGVQVFEGELNPNALEYAFNALIERHEMLRTIFREDEHKEVRQFILKANETGFKISYHDLRYEEKQEAVLKEFVTTEARKPFNLVTGPMVRAALFQVSDHQWVFTYAMHHIISDGWSMGILIDELLIFYNQYDKGEKQFLPPLRIQYKDYSAWQHAQLSGVSLQEHKTYWLKQFDSEIPVLELPGDKIRPAIKTYNGGAITTQIGKGLSNGIKKLCKEEDCTLFIGLLAAVNGLFCRYTGEEDIVIGTPVAGRDHIDLEDQIGFYVNTLALRTRFKKQDSYRELLLNTRQVALGAYEHQVYPFDRLVTELSLQRDMSRNPLFDVQVIVQHAETGGQTKKQRLGTLKVGRYEGVENQGSVFDIVFNFIETGEGLQVRIVYNNDVYSKRAILQLTTHLQEFIKAIIDSPDKPIDELVYLGEEDRNQLIIKFNGRGIDFAEGKTVIDLFREQVIATPGEVAVVSGTALTYKQLEEKSDQLAAYLAKTYSIQPGQLIGVMLDRSEQWIITILGILKAGGAYLPIDPGYPRARKEFIIKDAALSVLITQTGYLFDLEYYQGNIFAIDIQTDMPDQSSALTMPAITPDYLAYVIYTSGSTGEPKAVMIDHDAAAKSIQSQKTIFDLKAGERMLQFSASSFDVSLFEIFIALLSGVSLYIISEEDKKNPLLLEQYVTTNRIEIAAIPPAYLQLLGVERLSTLKKLITGGESADPSSITAFCRHGIYYNAYGPTESALCTSIYKIDKGTCLESSNVPIGTPIPGVLVYIVDKNNHLLPVGVTGELLIGGFGLAKGYMNNKELTEKKFFSDPFRKGGRIYKTGDLARWLPDGNIEFIGRKDEQVKINGYRVEPGEIENRLKEKPGIDAAVVIARTNQNGAAELLAYVVARQILQSIDLKAWLSKTLPAYMLPAHYVQLDRLPLSINGKIDKQQLPEPEGFAMPSGIEYIAPKNESQQQMVRIWENILGKEGIGISNSFFDMGGDSIKILQMTAAVRKELNLDIPVADIYKHDTIAAILDHVWSNKKEMDHNARVTKERQVIAENEINDLKERILLLDIPGKENIEDIYPMSDIEKGMIYESLVQEKSSIYHDQIVHKKVFVDFDMDRFRKALKLMADKHSILRTGFHVTEYETEVQIVYRQIEEVGGYEDLSGLTRDAQEEYISDFMATERKNSFRFSVAPLWRMNVFNLGENEIAFLFQTHHSIIDGWSDASFIAELNNIYLELHKDPFYKPQLLKSGYKDFIIQQEAERKNDSIRQFWHNELAEYTRLDLFTIYDQFQSYTNYLGESDFKKLATLSATLNTNIKVISLTAYLYMLKMLSYSDEIVAGLVTNNRPDYEDGDKILGCFLNTIPLKIPIDEEKSFAQLVHMVHNKLIELKNYERLSMFQISQLHGRQLNAGNPFFDTLFNYVDFHTYKSITEESSHKEEKNLPPLNVRGHGRTNTFFDFTVDVTGGNYRMSLGLTKKLRSGFTAQQVGELFFTILERIFNVPGLAVKEIEWVEPIEKSKLVEEFNDTGITYPEYQTITDLFEEQVARTPDKIALVYENASLTYKELNERSNQFANYLAEVYNVRPDDLLGIQSARNEWMIISVLAVLKSGGAYVPVEAETPADRVNYIMNDARCKVLINENEIKKFKDVQHAYAVTNLQSQAKSGDLAYVMYTSGTMGHPKGVMIEHRSVVRLVKQANYVTLIGEETLLSTGAFAFDATTFEYWGMLLNGGRLVISSQEILLDEKLLTEIIRKERVNIMWFTAGWFNQLVDRDVELFNGLKTILVGGDKLSVFHIDILRRRFPNLEIINGYGPTENTTFSLCYSIGSVPELIPVGKPISNSVAYIIGSGQQLCPIGVTGEICVGGDGLARGYLNKPELTNEKFVTNPLRKGERMYRTGDLGRWLADGNIEFAGRKDAQVKIRGYRIEPQEIEYFLQQYPAIDSAAVITRTNPEAEKELVAYIVSKEILNTSLLRAYFETGLPAYMLPSHFVQLDKLPLTANGKLDRKALPDPEEAQLEPGAAYIAPRNETERKLTAIWQDLLGKEKIGMQDNFFESGGHSLKVMKLVARIHKEFNVKIKLGDVFAKATIEEIAKAIVRQNWIRKNKDQEKKPIVSDENVIL